MKIPTAGEPCVTGAFDHECDATSYCDYATSTCLARHADGDACRVTDRSCGPRSHCDAATDRCARARAPGAACKTSDECGANATCTNGVCTSDDAIDLGLQIVCA